MSGPFSYSCRRRNADPINSRSAARGFTLVEVILSLALTSLILGLLSTGVYIVTEDSYRNLGDLNVAIEITNDEFQVRTSETLEAPLRKTEASLFALQPYETNNDDRDEIVMGSRWIQLELAK